jgi:hypothetical protein
LWRLPIIGKPGGPGGSFLGAYRMLMNVHRDARRSIRMANVNGDILKMDDIWGEGREYLYCQER